MIDPSLLPNKEQTKPDDPFSDDEHITVEEVMLVLKLIFNNFYMIQFIMWTLFIMLNFDLFLYFAFKIVGLVFKLTTSVFEILVFINHNV